MRKLRPTLLVVCALSIVVSRSHAQSNASNARAEIDAFNRALEDATRSMSNSATLALWADDGTSLLPSTAPIVGKKAIAAFLEDVISQLHDAHMEKFEMQCFDVKVSGDWASEWCTEHQLVQLGGGKPPFEGWGKMLLVLHRGTDAKWRLQTEMWNQAAAPGTK